MTSTQFYVGLMSGTSVDGIDAVLCEFDGDRFIRVAATSQFAYRPALRDQLLELGRHESSLTLERLAILDRAIADAFADAVLKLVAEQGLSTSKIEAVGSHGQTAFHRGGLAGEMALTLQLGDPSWIAARSGLRVVADFRRLDIAVGGQGAPLMPAFHAAVFGRGDRARAVLNLGGIANLTLLPPAPDAARGFDVGPANALLDQWSALHLDAPFDADGAWAKSGMANQDVIQALLSDPYFSLPPPKSTGRGDFNLAWARRLAPMIETLPPADVQASFLEVATRSIAADLITMQPSTRELFVCGGGIRNGALMQRLGELLATAEVAILSTAVLGVDPQAVEGAGFAWLAMRRLREQAGNLPTVTGAARPVRLGGIYDGRPFP